MMYHDVVLNHCSIINQPFSIAPGTIKLPNVPRPRLKVCVLGDAVHCEQAQRVGSPRAEGRSKWDQLGYMD